MGKVRGRFAFLCVQFIFHFVLLALNCACLGALQYWLGYVCKCETSARRSTCYKDETITICSNPCTTAMFKVGSQQLLAIRRANTGTSTVDGDTEQHFRAREPCTMHCMCSYTCTKGFQLWTLTFQESSIGTKIRFIGKSCQEIH